MRSQASGPGYVSSSAVGVSSSTITVSKWDEDEIKGSRIKENVAEQFEDLDELREELEGLAGKGELKKLESQLKQLRSEMAKLKPEHSPTIGSGSQVFAAHPEQSGAGALQVTKQIGALEAEMSNVVKQISRLVAKEESDEHEKQHAIEEEQRKAARNRRQQKNEDSRIGQSRCRC